MDIAVLGTHASRIHQQLRHDIVRGQLKAASKLKLVELQQRYRIGLAPLREALSRLCGEQLVVSADQRGFWVAALSLQELDDIAKVRVLVVNEAMNDSIVHGDAAWEVQVSGALAALAEIERDLSGSSTQPPGDVLDALEARNFAFHRALLGACRSPWLLRLQDMFYHQAERYRYAALPRSRDKRFSLDEHIAIADAALARNVIKACRLHDEHMARTQASVRAALEQHLQRQDAPPQARAGR